jgi:hypothetical protein
MNCRDIQTCVCVFAYRLGIHCKKGKRFSRPQPGCHQPNSPWPGIVKLLPAEESLVSDIPAGDGEIGNLFLQCTLYIICNFYIRKQNAL